MLIVLRTGVQRLANISSVSLWNESYDSCKECSSQLNVQQGAALRENLILDDNLCLQTVAVGRVAAEIGIVTPQLRYVESVQGSKVNFAD